MSAITKVRGQICFCKECGNNDDHSYFTPINHDGPYCISCIEEAAEDEENDNGQFGVGA